MSQILIVTITTTDEEIVRKVAEFAATMSDAELGKPFVSAYRPIFCSEALKIKELRAANERLSRLAIQVAKEPQ